MPTVHSKPTTDKEQKVHIAVKRPERMFAIDIDCTMADAPRIARAMNDAVDIVIQLEKIEAKSPLKKYPDSIVIEWDMIKMRKVCQHKGDDEENMMIKLISGFCPAVGLKVNEIGFPLDKKGNVISDDKLIISVSKLEESDIKRV